MTASIKIRQLESRISDLQSQHLLLLTKERLQEIAVLLSVVDLAHLDDKILMGGLLFLKEQVTTQDPILEAWRDASEKFLRRTKPKTRPRELVEACSLLLEKQEETFSRIPWAHSFQTNCSTSDNTSIVSKTTSIERKIK